MTETYEYVIAGAGVIGLTLARELAQTKSGRILVIEKEDHVGEHASGRNSGVVHAGLYYTSDSLKARFCVEGSKRLLAYCDEHNLPILKCGKVIVATQPETVPTLDTLLERAKLNGVVAQKISLEELKELEPEAKSHDFAIWSPKTAVIDSKMVLQKLLSEIQELGVTVKFGEAITNADPEQTGISTTHNSYKYGFFYNTAGTQADKIAHSFGVARKYRILPFKGLYWKSSPAYSKRVQRLIYPAPDVNMPFLGVHITKTVDGKVLFGPTAIPAFGRENYLGVKGVKLREGSQITWNLTKMLIRNPGGFRNYAFQEMSRYRPANFFNETKRLVHRLEPEDIGEFYKVGIRAQLMDLEKGRLEMDFVAAKGPRSLHVLNAISPAFTSAFSFASYLVSESHK
jgi:(S)-2-hydroxyglutarate dehydrogenase